MIIILPFIVPTLSLSRQSLHHIQQQVIKRQSDAINYVQNYISLKIYICFGFFNSFQWLSDFTNQLGHGNYSFKSGNWFKTDSFNPVASVLQRFSEVPDSEIPDLREQRTFLQSTNLKFCMKKAQRNGFSEITDKSAIPN